MAKISKILYATDFSEGSAIAAEYARALADLHQAQVLVLHVANELADSNRLRIQSDNYAELERSVEKLALTNMKEFCPRYFKAGSYETRLEIGIPFKVINDVAKSEKVDLIVVGTHGRTGLALVVLGSTAARVVRKSAVPVLTVPTLA
ncbi:MAG: universal stress protein [Desulfuromonadaceae bacterium]|nr:universal stress protein [Desulfuromonas sp.]MDY0184842.1 universal stress protein [Desulfuromonadaceae bacterium]